MHADLWCTFYVTPVCKVYLCRRKILSAKVKSCLTDAYMNLSGITNQIKRMTGGIVDLYRAGLSSSGLHDAGCAALCGSVMLKPRRRSGRRGMGDSVTKGLTM